jgi:hypothetical protein
MAIIPCRECAHQISDQAASCPGCGAPVTPTIRTKPRLKRVIFRASITVMALWTLGTLLWLLLPGSPMDQLITLANSSLHRLNRGLERPPTTDLTQATYQTQGAHRSAAADQPRSSTASASSDGSASSSESNSPPLSRTADRSAFTLPAPGQSAPPPRPVYRTTAEQLYQDYDANVVAIQSKIGASRVRLTGSVAEIDQDVAGRPVVKLWTGKDSIAAMTLAENQRAASAQLFKGEAVEIECDKIGHSGALLQGSDCTLAFVDVRPREVNLALLLANENGTTRVYVVGPMSEAVCLARSDDISSRLQVNQRGEHLVWRNCTDAARESIPPRGCRLNFSSVTIPELPTAHLSRYDCSSSTVTRTSARKRTPTSSPGNGATLASTAAHAAMGPTPESATGTAPPPASPSAGNERQDATAAPPIPLAAVDSKAVEGTPPASATSPAGTAAPVDAAIAVPARRAAEQAVTNNIHLASAGDSDTGTATAAARAPAEEVTVAHAPRGRNEDTANLRGESRDTTSPGTIATPDDLAKVRAVDPRAAEHIAAYCSKTIASTNRDTFVAECRRREAEAWTRLVLQKEFPSLDEATRKKCSEPPFPDTYVAQESCARYELHAN